MSALTIINTYFIANMILGTIFNAKADFEGAKSPKTAKTYSLIFITFFGVPIFVGAVIGFFVGRSLKKK